MKFLVVFATVLACAFAKPGAPAAFGYTAFNGAFPAAPAVYSGAFPASTGPIGAPLAAPYAAAPLAAPYAAAPLAAPYAAPFAAPYAAPFAPAPLAYAAAPVPIAAKTQYHAQDELGQASYGYSYPGQAQSVVRDAAGNEAGSYAYINPEGREIRVDYTAGHGGFRAASNALPVAPLAVPLDTPEVAAAKSAHFAAYNEAAARSGRKKRGAPAFAAPLAAPIAGYTPAATALTAYAAPIPAVYAAAPPRAFSYAYTAPAPIAPVAPYAAAFAPAFAPAPAPVAYAAGPAPLAYAAAPATRLAELTKVHLNPGHAVSYRVD